jgi:hypothetical protein
MCVSKAITVDTLLYTGHWLCQTFFRTNLSVHSEERFVSSCFFGPVSRKIIFPQQSGVLTVGLLFADSLGLDSPPHRRSTAPYPVLPATARTSGSSRQPPSPLVRSLLASPVPDLGFSGTVVQLPFPILSRFGVDKRDGPIARVIIHAYNDHVGFFLPSQ